VHQFAYSQSKTIKLLLPTLVLLSSACVHTATAIKIHDLSQPYEKAPVPFPEADDLKQIADEEFWWNGYLALECGQVVAEQYDQVVADETTKKNLYSVTKSWTGLLFGVMHHEGIIQVNETLWDIFPNETIWENMTDVELRKEITIDMILRMSTGLQVPDERGSDMVDDLNPLNDQKGGKAGGVDLLDSLGYLNMNESMIGYFEYLPIMNLPSYIILE
jgi:hypothetical protein